MGPKPLNMSCVAIETALGEIQLKVFEQQAPASVGSRRSGGWRRDTRWRSGVFARAEAEEYLKSEIRIERVRVL